MLLIVKAIFLVGSGSAYFYAAHIESVSKRQFQHCSHPGSLIFAEMYRMQFRRHPDADTDISAVLTLLSSGKEC